METLSKNKLKYFTSFKQKKFRDQNRLFVVEGSKSISDFVESGVIPKILIVDNQNVDQFFAKNIETFSADKEQISKLTNLSESPDAIAFFTYFDTEFDSKSLIGQLTLYCDGIQNPGNLGTIIRTAEWFGVQQILCSSDTADCYNPKVVQATMGSLARVNVFYVDFLEIVEFSNTSILNIYGTFMEGTEIYDLRLPQSGIVVVGNEGKGIRPQIEKFVDQRISIPRFLVGNKPESLNVSVAAALVLSEFRRQAKF